MILGFFESYPALAVAVIMGFIAGITIHEAAHAWSAYMLGSLRDLITTGKGDPHRADGDFNTETDKHEAVNKTTTA